MNIVQKYPVLGSSVDQQKLSMTVKGILGFVATGVILVAGLVGVSISNEELQPIIDGIVDIIAQITALISAVMFVWGGLRKLYLKFFKK